MTDFGAAWRFLTRVPIGRADDDGAVMHLAPRWFPLVGAIVGLVVGATYAAGSELVGPTTAAALAITVGALVTGAFHHDGLADIADAYGGGWNVEQRLAILKDSRHGTYGVMALVCIVAVQVTALAQCSPAQGLAVAVAAHSGARGGAVALLRWAPRARVDGLGAGLDAPPATQATPPSAGGRVAGHVVAVALVVAVGFAVLALGALSAWTIVAVAIAAGSVHALSQRKIGGVTGDALGAAEQVAETAVLVCGAAFVQHAGAWPWWR